ncbi:MAG: hypothetical protein AB1420_14310 [Bacillota bacterium]
MIRTFKFDDDGYPEVKKLSRGGRAVDKKMDMHNDNEGLVEEVEIPEQANDSEIIVKEPEQEHGGFDYSPVEESITAGFFNDNLLLLLILFFILNGPKKDPILIIILLVLLISN